MTMSKSPSTIDRRTFIGSLAAAAVSAACGRMGPDAAGRPNLLFILADDLGYADLSSFGRADYQTPNIDRLVQQGVRFANAYTAASTCTPTRVGFLTGRYPQRYDAALQNPMPMGSSAGLSPDNATLPSLLRQAGYRTSLVGKWHLGFEPRFSPLRHGFDEFFGIKSGGADYFTHTGRTGALDLWDGDVAADRAGYLTDLLSDRAAEYVGRRHDAPFYLSLHYNAPHWPWEGPADTHGPNPTHPFSDGGSKETFAAMMKSLDDGVGRVMAALERAGRDRDTLVIFASDNGGERYSDNRPWKEGKFTLWEGGIRVPLALRWPGRIEPGGTSDQVAITMDWTATLVAAAGAAADPQSPLDGIDLLPFATGQRADASRTLFWRQPYPPASPHAAARQGQWKYLRIGDAEHLFDLETDPGEKTDVASRFPDVHQSLRSAWGSWNQQMLPVPTP
jgi:arylsulfatase A-like enzyme